MDLAGAQGPPGPAGHPHRPRRAEASGNDLLLGGHDRPGRGGQAAAPGHRRGRVQRGVPDRRADPRRRPDRAGRRGLEGGQRHADERAGEHRRLAGRAAGERHDRHRRADLAFPARAAHARTARPDAAAVDGRRGGPAGGGAAAPAAGRGPARTRGLRRQAGLRPPQPGDLRVRGRTRRRRRAALRRLDHAPPGERQLLRPRSRIPLPARQGELHRGRDLGDPAQHRRRAGARPPRRTPCRQERAMEGPTAMSEKAGGKEDLPDLLYSDTERALSDALAALLADRGGTDSVLKRIESAQTYDDKLWEAVGADLGCAGLLIPERDGGAGASYREAAAAAEVLGAYVAPVTFLGSAVVATAALLSVNSHGVGSQGSLLAKMAGGGVTAALAVPFSSPPGA